MRKKMLTKKCINLFIYTDLLKCNNLDNVRYGIVFQVELDLPVILSHRILEVIIWPNALNKFSRSCCVMLFESPETYKLAPLMASELGRA